MGNEEINVSPVKLVATATNVPPIHMYATQGDPVPFQQGEEMATELALYHPGAVFEFYKINNSALHAFNYWNQVNEVTDECVSAEVIDFLQDYL